MPEVQPVDQGPLPSAGSRQTARAASTSGDEMAINWNKLRPWNGSAEDAFEELCSQLAAAESVPDGSRFFRKGTPDAGVECFWRLPKGDEWGWQAKFFRSSPDKAQWKQIDESVNTALKKHPNLTQYTICLPIDLSDARVGNRESSLEKWGKRVSRWRQAAEKTGMSVSFDYWGQSEIGLRLSDEKHRGRHWFWFNEESLSNSWFIKRVEEQVANAGERYRADLNIELPIGRFFDALGGTPVFCDHLIDKSMDSHCFGLSWVRGRPSAAP